MTQLPDELQRVVAEALSALRDDPQHHLHPYYRQRLYKQARVIKAPGEHSSLGQWLVQKFSNQSRGSRNHGERTSLGAQNLTFGERLLGWLAILSAERVLPIFEAAPETLKSYMKADYGLPPDLLQLARGAIHGMVDPKEAISIASDAHETYGNALNESEYDPHNFPLDAVLAATAAKEALEEATGSDPITSYARVTGRGERWPEPPAKPGQHRHGADDEKYPRDPFLRLLEPTGPDAASYAATAYAWDAKANRFDPIKLQEFWTWWLTEALPAAWKLATGETEPS